jgi:hypothetical protein
MTGELRQVFDALAKRRQVNMEDVEPVVEVFAKLTVLLENSQQLDLHERCQLADLVEKQGPALGLDE